MEAARMGHIFGTNHKAYRKWRSSFDRASRPVKPLGGIALEAAIARIGEQFPGHVVRGSA